MLPEALRAALVGRYTIERELGRGGMARVYLARDERHAREVALKLLRPELVPDGGPARAATRFQREIAFAARLSHPHILPLFDSGAVEGLLYYITPYVDGETLRDRIRREGRLPLQESLRILRDITSALAYAHREGVIHRDIKPANILLNRDGDALVADFGVAKALAAAQGGDGGEGEITDAALVLGTPAYMAPEQVTSSAEVDHRADLYALGALAYELLTGSAPFAGRSRHEQLSAHVSEIPEPVTARNPDVPVDLAKLVDRLLSKSPDRRPADANEVIRLLDGATATKSERRLHIRGRLSHRRAEVIAVAVVLVAVTTGVAAYWRMRPTSTRAPVAVAVLPFARIGDSAVTEHLAVGLSDGISNDLARLGSVQARSYVTTSIYRETLKSSKQIASEQHARALVRGSVESSGGRVRVNTQLLDNDGRQLWQQRYEKPASDVQGIEREMMRDIVSHLGVPVTPADRDILARGGDIRPAAYDLFLRGRAVELSGQSREPWRSIPVANIREAISFYAQARDLDHNFAYAHARLALMQGLAAARYDTTRARREQVRLEAEAALRLRPDMPEAHQALASYWDLTGDLNRAIDELKIATEQFPHSSELRMAFGRVLERAERLPDAVLQYEQAMQLDPGSPKAGMVAGVTYSRLRRPDDARRAFNHAIAAAPDYHMAKVIKGQGYLRWTGNADTLAEAMRTVPPEWDPDGMATYARFTALFVQRRPAAALAMLDRSRTTLSRDGLVYAPTSLMHARLYDALGEHNLALESYAAARSVLRDSVAAHPADATIRAALGLACAGLGRTDEAVRETRRALQLAPMSSAVMGVAVEAFARAGKKREAFDLMELLFSMSAGREITVPMLRAWPGFDPLRSDPRFDELMARFAARTKG